jgi:hypothetical protein
MKLLIKIILIAALAYLLEQILPWWSIAIAAFAVEVAMGKPKGLSFISGFVIVAYIIDMKNEHILAAKVAEVLPLGGSTLAILLVTATIGGLVGGLAGAAGREFKRAFVI